MFPRDDSVVDSLIALQDTPDINYREENISSNKINSSTLTLTLGSTCSEDQKIIKSESCQKDNIMLCTSIDDPIFGNKNTSDNEGDAYNLYVSNEMFDKIISNASNVDINNDVYLACQEVETNDGKMLMMTSDGVNDKKPHNDLKPHDDLKPQHDSKFKSPLDSLIKFEDTTDKANKDCPINYIEETILSPNVLETEADALHSSADRHESRENQCLICDRVFYNLSSYRQHYANFHLASDKSALSCWECKQNFKYAAAYIKHKVSEHPNSDNLCTICGELLATTRSLSNHLKSHLNKQSYTCNTCGRAFRTQQSRQDHIKNKHLRSKDSSFACMHCGSTFQHGRSLVRHVNCVHAKQRVVCPTCNKSYSSISSLYFHQRTIHENVAFHCGYCSMTFKSVSAVRKHENEMHHDVTRYRETSTEKVYNYNQFVTHQVDSLERKTSLIKCLFCKAEYHDHARYAKHYNKFHKEENVDINLSCPPNKNETLEIPGPSFELGSNIC